MTTSSKCVIFMIILCNTLSADETLFEKVDEYFRNWINCEQPALHTQPEDLPQPLQLQDGGSAKDLCHFHAFRGAAHARGAQLGNIPWRGTGPIPDLAGSQDLARHVLELQKDLLVDYATCGQVDALCSAPAILGKRRMMIGVTDAVSADAADMVTTMQTLVMPGSAITLAEVEWRLDGNLGKFDHPCNDLFCQCLALLFPRIDLCYYAQMGSGGFRWDRFVLDHPADAKMIYTYLGTAHWQYLVASTTTSPTRRVCSQCKGKGTTRVGIVSGRAYNKFMKYVPKLGLTSETSCQECSGTGFKTFGSKSSGSKL